jgi:NAD(P)H-dependent FMN reductase
MLMSGKVRVLAFAGSARKDSWNKKLVGIAAKGAEAAGADVTLIDFRDYPMPLYDGDLEAAEGIPEHGQRFKLLMIEHDGFLISSPEYNSSITPLLKNSIDWASRSSGAKEPPLVAFQGKVAALMSASPGGLGGLRGLVHLRSILGNIGVLVMPGQVAVPRAQDACAADGIGLKDPAQHASIEKLGADLVALLKKLKG